MKIINQMKIAKSMGFRFAHITYKGTVVVGIGYREYSHTNNSRYVVALKKTYTKAKLVEMLQDALNRMGWDEQQKRRRFMRRNVVQGLLKPWEFSKAVERKLTLVVDNTTNEEAA